MESIENKPNNNLGGAAKILVTPHKNILVQPRSVRGIIKDDIVLADQWYEIEAVTYTIRFTENMSIEDPAETYKMSVSFTLAQDQPELSFKIGLLKSQKLAVLIQDHQSQWRLIGSKHEFLTFEQKLDTGSKPSNLNGYDISLSGKHKNKSSFYQGTLITEPLAPPNLLTALLDTETSTVNVSWDGSTGAFAYELYRAEADSDVFVKIDTLEGNITEYNDDTI